MVTNPGARSILLVDDSRDEREMYAEWFRLQGYCTLQADTAGHAYRLASELVPDVAVVDVSLTGAEDGLHLTRQLKRNATTCSLPVIILTGHVFPFDREQALRAGCDLFVPKPCRPDVLGRAIDQLVQQRCTASR